MHSDHSPPMHSARDDLAVIARFNLEGDLTSLGLNDSRGAVNRVTDRSRRQVAQFNLHADGSLVRFQTGRECIARRAFEESNQIRSRKHGRHAAVGEINGMSQLDFERQLAGRACFGSAFHVDTGQQTIKTGA